MKFLLILILAGVLSTSVFNGRQVINNKESYLISEIDVLPTQDSEKLSFCFSCHNPNVQSHDQMLAPPLAGIKMQYLKRAPDREEFIRLMGDFVKNPTEEAAIMKGPLRRFGLMPKPALTDEEIQAIVAYIYDNDIPQPAWYEEHHKKMHGDQ